MISEAARMAYTLSYHKTASSEIGQLKAFWVIYYLEKLTTFSECTSSVGTLAASWFGHRD
jgi:hypothetical protein